MERFLEGTAVAKELKLYGAGQDLLSDTFSGNIKEWVLDVQKWNLRKGLVTRWLFSLYKTEPGIQHASI